MSTRSGDLDPGVVWYLRQTEGITPKRFNEMVNFKSGLLGVSETSSDMHDLLEAETEDIRASEAVALFCYAVKKCIGAYAAALGGTRHAGVRGRHWGECTRGPRPDMRRAGISWGRVGRKTKQGQRRVDFHGGQPGRRTCHAHRRGMDDRKVSLSRSRPPSEEEGLATHEYAHRIRHRSRHWLGTWSSRLLGGWGIKRFPLIGYVIGVAVAWTVILAVMWVLGDIARFQTFALVCLGFALGMLAMYVAVHVYRS